MFSFIAHRRRRSFSPPFLIHNSPPSLLSLVTSSLHESQFFPKSVRGFFQPLYSILLVHQCKHLSFHLRHFLFPFIFVYLYEPLPTFYILMHSEGSTFFRKNIQLHINCGVFIFFILTAVSLNANYLHQLLQQRQLLLLYIYAFTQRNARSRTMLYTHHWLFIAQ